MCFDTGGDRVNQMGICLGVAALLALLTVVLLFILLPASQTQPGQASMDTPHVQAEAAVLLDGDSGEVLFGKKANVRTSVASLTKIMTLFLTAESIDEGKVGLADKVTITPHSASAIPIKIGYKPGEKVSLRELMYASALHSANDAARALAEYLGGSEEAFARWMSDRARAIGLINTNFVDATGLLPMSSGSYSTAYEMAVLTQTAMGNSLFRRLVRTREFSLPSRPGTSISNFNELLGSYPGAEGVKTGTTTPAGYCLAAAAKRDGWRLITIVLGAKSDDGRYESARSLLDWGFTSFQLLFRQGDVLGETPVKGRRVRVDVVSPINIRVLNPGGEDDRIRTRLSIAPKPEIPLSQGQQLGELIIYRDGREIKRVPAVARRDVKQRGVLLSILEWIMDLLGLF